MARGADRQHDSMRQNHLIPLESFKDIYEIRRANLRFLLQEQFGESRAKLANALGIDLGSSALHGYLTKKNIGSGKARHIEERCNIPRGWLDIDHFQHLPLDASQSAIERTQFSRPVRLLRSKLVPVMGKFGKAPLLKQRRLLYYAEIIVKDPQAFGVIAETSVLSPRIQAGDTVIIAPTTIPRIGNMVFVRLDDGTEIIRQLANQGPDWISLADINQSLQRELVNLDRIIFCRPVVGILPEGYLLPIDQVPLGERGQGRSLVELFSHRQIEFPPPASKVDPIIQDKIPQKK